MAEVDIEVVKSCLVYRAPQNDGGPLTPDDFRDYLATLDDRVDVFEKVDWCSASLDVLITTTLFIGQHSSGELPDVWTTDKSRRVASALSVKLGEMVTRDSHPSGKWLAEGVLKELQPKLLKSNFKQNPACVVCFDWFVRTTMSHGFYGLFTSLVPSALVLVDDYECQYQIVGLKCLTSLVSSTTKSDLTLYNHDRVIADAIKPLFYHCDPQVVPHLLDCFITLLDAVQSGYYTDSKRIKMDELIDVTLNNAFLETRQAVKESYAEYLPKLVEARGLGSVLHLSRVYDILDDLCFQPDYMLHGLEALESVVKTCWMRPKTVYDRTIRLILRTTALLNRTNDPSLLAKDKRRALQLRMTRLGDLVTSLWPAEVADLIREINTRTGLGYLLIGILPSSHQTKRPII